MSADGHRFGRWVGPWRIGEVWTSGLPSDDPSTLDQHGGTTAHRWVREYQEEPHCERCSPQTHVVFGPVTRPIKERK